MHVRRKLIVGNWKMNGDLARLKELGAVGTAAKKAAGVDVAICPPFTLIAAAGTRAKGMTIGAQDCHSEKKGAFTGSVSAAMISEAGAKLVILGHSERRAGAGETDAEVRAKAEAALRRGLAAIVCVGESARDREAGKAVKVVKAQLKGSLPDQNHEGELVVAYEPIWAIGTGRNCAPKDVAEMHKAIRSHLVESFGDAGGRIRILYGGSVKPSNVAALFAAEDVDGALVGGASLTAAEFVPIIEAAAKA